LNDKIAAGMIAAGIPLLEMKKEKLHEIQFCIFTAVKNVLQTCKKREKKEDLT
jgi:predicted aconitase with swiveling domain